MVLPSTRDGNPALKPAPFLPVDDDGPGGPSEIVGKSRLRTSRNLTGLVLSARACTDSGTDRYRDFRQRARSRGWTRRRVREAGWAFRTAGATWMGDPNGTLPAGVSSNSEVGLLCVAETVTLGPGGAGADPLGITKPGTRTTGA